jgi:hypothetical protein
VQSGVLCRMLGPQCMVKATAPAPVGVKVVDGCCAQGVVSPPLTRCFPGQQAQVELC